LQNELRPHACSWSCWTDTKRTKPDGSCRGVLPPWHGHLRPGSTPQRFAGPSLQTRCCSAKGSSLVLTLTAISCRATKTWFSSSVESGSRSCRSATIPTRIGASSRAGARPLLARLANA
jgi:hypothetical protein